MTRLMTAFVVLISCTTLLLSCSKNETVNNRPPVAAKPSPAPYIEPITRPSPTPDLPTPTPKIAMTEVRFRVIDSNDEPAGGVAVVFVESDDENTVSAAVTDYSGSVSVEEVPCNRNMFLHLWQYGGNRDRFKNTSHKRYIKCGKAGVDLGEVKIKCICPNCERTPCRP